MTNTTTGASDAHSEKPRGEHDDVRFTIELAMRGVGYRHRRRKKPYVQSEDDAHVMAGRAADALRAKYEFIRKPPVEQSWVAPPASTD
ncbi:MAG: hypothetical protein AAF414_13670 [Pseudomonadota bacterium]